MGAQVGSEEDLGCPEKAGSLGDGDRSLDIQTKRQKVHLQVNPPTDASEEFSSILYLNLRKSPSRLNLIQSILYSEFTLTRKTMQSPDSRKTKTKSENKVHPPLLKKLKASNFPAALLQIGCWQRVAKNESDVVAKIYFSKRKLVWEILEHGLKSKMEIQWSDIIAIKATYLDEQHDILEVELCQPPQFYHETNTQPKKHTNWEATSDFTQQQASLYRRHYLKFVGGTLERHYEKLLSSDPGLRLLSQRPFPSHPSLYFKVEHDEMQAYPYELSMHQLSQYFGNPVTPQHIGAFAFGGLGPTVSRTPFLGSNMRVTAMNSSSSANNLAIVDGNAAIYLNESTSPWDQGFQNPRIVDTVEHPHQHQGPPLSPCTTLAPNDNPRRDTDVHRTSDVKSEIEIIEKRLFCDLSSAEEQRLLAEVDSYALYVNETKQLGSQPQSFNQAHGGGFDVIRIPSDGLLRAFLDDSAS